MVCIYIQNIKTIIEARVLIAIPFRNVLLVIVTSHRTMTLNCMHNVMIRFVYMPLNFTEGLTCWQPLFGDCSLITNRKQLQQSFPGSVLNLLSSARFARGMGTG